MELWTGRFIVNFFTPDENPEGGSSWAPKSKDSTSCSRRVFSLSSQRIRVNRVGRVVADEVEGESSRHDAEGRIQRPRLLQKKTHQLGLFRKRAPIGLGRLDAQPRNSRRSFGHYLTGAGEGDGDDTMTEDVEQHVPKDDGSFEGAGVIIPRTWGRAMESLS